MPVTRPHSEISEMDENPENNIPPMVPPPVAPPIDMSTVPPPQPYQQAQPIDAKSDPMRFVMPVNPSGWCIAAGYLGLFSLVLVFAPFSLLAAGLGLRDLKLNPDKTGKGRAWFGLVMGLLGTGILLLLIADWAQRRN